MTIAQERLFKQMGGREAYDELNRLAPAWAAKLEAEYTRLFDLAEDRTMEEDAQYLGKVNPAKGIAKWNVIKSWQDAIEWWIAHPEKLYLTEDPKEALTRNESPVM